MTGSERNIVAAGLRSIGTLEAVPTVETALFVTGRVSCGARLLEIGCGNGELAMLLGRVGIRVTALDTNPEAVERTRAKGVEVVEAAWPDADVEGPFDAVLFSRSLHHLDDLHAALERARDVTSPGGELLVEDFACEAIDARTAAWLRTRLRDAADRGLLQDGDSFAARVATIADDDSALDAWHGEHGDGLHTSLAMDAAIRTVYGEIRSARCPYLYRYLPQALRHDRDSFLALREWLAAEQAATAGQSIEPLGRRYQARAGRDA